jgi:hypothetical protein
MAYLVKYGDATLFTPGDDDYAIHGARLSQSADGVARFEFTVPPTHPEIDIIAVRDMAHPVEVYFDGVLLFSGFVSSLTTGLWLETTVTCQSFLALLGDVTVRYKPTYRDGNHVLAELIGIWSNLTTWGGEIDQKKVEFAVDPQSQASQVGYEDPSTHALVVDADTMTPKGILQIILDSMVEPYGAFIRTRKAQDGTYLVGVFPNAPDTSTQTVYLGENLLDYSYTETDEGMYNACLPVGGAVDPRTVDRGRSNVVLGAAVSVGDRWINIRTTSGTSHVTTGDVLVIGGKHGYAVEGGANHSDFGTGGISVQVTPRAEASFSAGTALYIQSQELYQKDENCTLMDINGDFGQWRVDYDLVYNVASAKTYGMKCWTYQDNDIRDAYALRNKAKAMTVPKLDFKRSLTVSALDMAFYLQGYDHLQAGQKLHVVSEPHGLDAVMYVRTADIDLDNPSNTRYVLGTVERTLSRQVRGVDAGVKANTDNFIKELNNRIPESTIRELQ